jgi:hypothetical protein
VSAKLSFLSSIIRNKIYNSADSLKFCKIRHVRSSCVSQKNKKLNRFAQDMATKSLIRSAFRSKFALKCASRRLLSSLRPGAELDTSYICDAERVSEIEENIQKRDAYGDIRLVQQLFQQYQNSKSEEIWKKFAEEALKIPNRTLEHREENKKIKVCFLSENRVVMLNIFNRKSDNQDQTTQANHSTTCPKSTTGAALKI